MCLLLLVALLAPPAAAPTPTVLSHEPAHTSKSELPSDKEIVAAVFANLATAFHPKQGCVKEECTVGGFLQNSLAYLGESERESKSGAWARSRCELTAVDAALRESLEPPRYSPKLAARAAKLGPMVWACELSFGHDPGTEAVWSREIYFWIEDTPAHKAVPDSFQFNYTP